MKKQILNYCLATLVVCLGFSAFAGELYAVEGSTVAQQSKVTVSGTVVDELDGTPIVGAYVIENGVPSNGTITENDGKFQIKVNSASATINVNFIGYETKEVQANGDKALEIGLVVEASSINEVVVTALGIKRESKALGYSVSKIDSKRVLASGTPSNPLQALYGSASGVQIAATAAGPTGGMKINIRNAISFDSSSTTRPLMVVDGIPIHDENTSMSGGSEGRDNGTGINDINPDDIASFEILKGAKASVLYGSEGANGVILITTKSGSKSRGVGVSASFTTTWDNIAFTPKLQNKYGSGQSASVTDTDDSGFRLNSNGERMLDYSGNAFGPKYDDSVELTWWDGSTKSWTPQDETIYEQMYGTGHQNTTNISISSGGEDGSMRLSLTNMSYSSIVPGAEKTQNSLSLSASRVLNDYISLKYSGNIYFSNNLNATNSTAMGSQGVTSSLGAYSADIDVDLIRKYLVTDAGYNYFYDESRDRDFISGGRSAVANFFWDQEQNLSDFSRVHHIHSLTMDIVANDNWGATLLAGLDDTSENNQIKNKLKDLQYYGSENANYFLDTDKVVRKTYGQGIINFDYDFDKINLSGFVGGAIKHNYMSKKGAATSGLVIPNYFSFENLASDESPQYKPDYGEDILYSVLGSVQVAWRNQLFVEIQGRKDWSSILPPGFNSYFYPGVSATWIANETFTLPEVIEFAKVRASWADVGRPGPRYFSNVNYGVSQSGGGYILTPPSDLPPMDENGSPNLKPERKREFEVGFETYLFPNKRIGIDFSYYQANTYDQIMSVTAPAGTGAKNIRMNAGDVQNNGWEVAIKTKPIHNPNFKWDLDLNFSGAKTKVNELDGSLTSLVLSTTEGLDFRADVGGEYGIITQQKGILIDEASGRKVVDDTGTNYKYSSEVNKQVGKMLPDVTGGMYTNFNYKNFNLMANLDYSFGATLISHTETYMIAAGVLDESLPFRDKESGGIAYHLDDSKAKVAGEGASTTFWDGVILDGVLEDGTENTQVVSAEDYYGESYFASSFFPEDRIFKSDYIALRNVSLQYNVPKHIYTQAKLTALSVSAFVNNVCYIYKNAPNTTPESANGTSLRESTTGTVALPSQRSIGLSVKLKF